MKLDLCRVKTVVQHGTVFHLSQVDMLKMELCCGISSFRLHPLNSCQLRTVLLPAYRLPSPSVHCWPSVLHVVLCWFLMHSRHCAGALAVLLVLEQNTVLSHLSGILVQAHNNNNNSKNNRQSATFCTFIMAKPL